MAGLKEIRIRLASVQSTQQITKAMKLVSATKLRRAQQAITQLRPYSQRLREIALNLLTNADIDELNELLKTRPVNHLTLLVITSDRGLCGAFNANVIKATLKLIQSEYKDLPKDKIQLVCIGKKGAEYFSRLKYNVDSQYVDMQNHLSDELVDKLSADLMHRFFSGKTDKITSIYNQFKNAATYLIREFNYLPLDPVRLEFAEMQNLKRDYITEPSQLELAKMIKPMVMSTLLYTFILDSSASEHGARMIAMDKATENAAELIKTLRLYYNQARQSTITREILEIVGGANALAEA